VVACQFGRLRSSTIVSGHGQGERDRPTGATAPLTPVFPLLGRRHFMAGSDAERSRLLGPHQRLARYGTVRGRQRDLHLTPFYETNPIGDMVRGTSGGDPADGPSAAILSPKDAALRLVLAVTLLVVGARLLI
jgi:hypothetical protein